VLLLQLLKLALALLQRLGGLRQLLLRLCGAIVAARTADRTTDLARAPPGVSSPPRLPCSPAQECLPMREAARAQNSVPLEAHTAALPVQPC
jgi:hypothetical protein